MNKGDVIQITNVRHNWYPCLLIVDEVRSWGVVAYALIPNSVDEPTSQAPIRLTTNDYERIGQAAITIGETS